MTVQRIYFDTEFTQFESPRLISIALVAEGSDREFYAEPNDTYQPSDCSDFVLDVVLPRLTRLPEHTMSEAHLSFRLAEWIEGFSGQVELISDAPAWDWPFIEQLFQDNGYGWPRNLFRQCGKPRDTHGKYGRRMAEYWVTHYAMMHNALTDARSLKYAEQKANQP